MRKYKNTPTTLVPHTVFSGCCVNNNQMVDKNSQNSTHTARTIANTMNSLFFVLGESFLHESAKLTERVLSALLCVVLLLLFLLSALELRYAPVAEFCRAGDCGDISPRLREFGLWPLLRCTSESRWSNSGRLGRQSDCEDTDDMGESGSS